MQSDGHVSRLTMADEALRYGVLQARAAVQGAAEIVPCCNGRHSRARCANASRTRNWSIAPCHLTAVRTRRRLRNRSTTPSALLREYCITKESAGVTSAKSFRALIHPASNCCNYTVTWSRVLIPASGRLSSAGSVYAACRNNFSVANEESATSAFCNRASQLTVRWDRAP